MTTPVALYLQDAHPIREGMEHARYAEAHGLRRGLAGREPPGAGGDGADGGLRLRDGADQGRLGRGRLLEPQPGPVGGHVLDARRPRARPHHPRPRRLVGPAGRARSASSGARPLTVMREVVTVVRALLHNETVTLRRRLRAPRRCRAGLRVPGAPVEGRAHLHRRHRHADDGADRRDRRWCRPQLPRLAGLQRAGDGAPGGRGRAGRAHRWTTSTDRSSSCARCTRTAPPRSTWPA